MKNKADWVRIALIGTIRRIRNQYTKVEKNRFDLSIVPRFLVTIEAVADGPAVHSVSSTGECSHEKYVFRGVTGVELRVVFVLTDYLVRNDNELPVSPPNQDQPNLTSTMPRFPAKSIRYRDRHLFVHKSTPLLCRWMLLFDVYAILKPDHRKVIR